MQIKAFPSQTLNTSCISGDQNINPMKLKAKKSQSEENASKCICYVSNRHFKKEQPSTETKVTCCLFWRRIFAFSQCGTLLTARDGGNIFYLVMLKFSLYWKINFLLQLKYPDTIYATSLLGNWFRDKILIVFWICISLLKYALVV